MSTAAQTGPALQAPRSLLLLLSLANLVIGTGAFVLGGILAPLSADLGVSVPAAGQAMTAYALSTACLRPSCSSTRPRCRGGKPWDWPCCCSP